MNKTKIEWVKNPDGTQGYTWNPITGCLNGCEYCYARKLANRRLRQRYLANHNVSPYQGEVDYEKNKTNPFYPRFWPERLMDTDLEGKKSKGIFVCDMGELFGDWIPYEWQDKIFLTFKMYPQHRFYLLTKQPQKLPQWSPFPDNCWVGVTATNWDMFFKACWELQDIKAFVKFISFEPLLDSVNHRELEGWLHRDGIKWVIIGACTGRMTEIAWLCGKYPELIPMFYGNKWIAAPPISWVEEIVRACDKAGAKVFLKDKLKPLILSHAQDKDAYWAEYILDKGGLLRQEMPG